MKHLSRVILAVLLAVLMGTLYPAQVFADTPDYISEVKVFEGNYDNAEKEGYTLLNGENGKPVDLNADAGATGIGGKGNKAVYLGYKTTKDKDEAITDLALMNMKGGYSVKEYEALMETQMKQQIIPFVDSFLATIKEYRENYYSDNTANQQRAQYIHDVLDKFTDDDCGGAGLGELLLNVTKYEMGDEAYNKLSDEEKKQHADILTIIAQSNGQATIMMQNLLTRAADTHEDSWVDRFVETSYDDLMDLTGKSPTDARKQLSKQYDDDATLILDNWDSLQEILLETENGEINLDSVEDIDYDAVQNAADSLEKDGEVNKDNAGEYAEVLEANINVFEYNTNLSKVSLYEFLYNTEYEDGTLLDFFMQDSADIEDDITVLYPLVASLSEGQRAGLEFVSLSELLSIAATDGDEYENYDISKVAPTSVYTNVDRAIYEKGGVALTSDALRADALARANEDDGALLSPLTIVLWSVTALSAVALVGSIVAKFRIDAFNATTAQQSMTEIMNIAADNRAVHTALIDVSNKGVIPEGAMNNLVFEEFGDSLTVGQMRQENADRLLELGAKAGNTGNVAKYLAIGVGVAMVVLAAVSTYFTYKNMCDYYKVDFTPIPHYMIDEKDLVGYNSKGEKIVLKNQSAYYKAVESNRKKGDSYFDDIDTCADMNGCVGKQWLALYAAKNEAMAPILASSLKVVVDSSDVPAGYATGIHMFGEDAAFNLNNKLYCWNDKAKSVMVYFKTDETAVSTTGSNFTGGTLALSAGGGLLLGAAVTALGMTASRKRKENKTVTV